MACQAAGVPVDVPLVYGVLSCIEVIRTSSLPNRFPRIVQLTPVVMEIVSVPATIMATLANTCTVNTQGST